MKEILVRGARTHNLKNINVSLPRDRLTVITGLSDQANPRWHLIPCMLKGSGGTLNHFRPMPASFCR